MPRFETDDGASLFYEVQGRDTSAPPLLFLHGWCSNLTHWSPQVQAFNRSHRLLRIDRRGMGRSTTPGSGHSAEQHARDAAAIAELEQLSGAVVVGHAGGGPSALALTRDYPERFKGLVMIDSAMYPLPELNNPDSAFGMVLGSMIDALSGADGKAALRTMYSGYFAAACDPEVSAKAIDDALQTPLDVAIAELKGMCVSTEQLASDVGVPVLWITAAPVDQAYLQQHVRQLWYGQVTGAGHFPQLEVPAQVNAMISTFLQQLPH